eukprot:2140841-Rhodomonas_salina.1
MDFLFADTWSSAFCPSSSEDASLPSIASIFCSFFFTSLRRCRIKAFVSTARGGLWHPDHRCDVGGRNCQTLLTALTYGFSFASSAFGTGTAVSAILQSARAARAKNFSRGAGNEKSKRDWDKRIQSGEEEWERRSQSASCEGNPKGKRTERRGANGGRSAPRLKKNTARSEQWNSVLMSILKINFRRSCRPLSLPPPNRTGVHRRRRICCGTD